MITASKQNGDFDAKFKAFIARQSPRLNTALQTLIEAIDPAIRKRAFAVVLNLLTADTLAQFADTLCLFPPTTENMSTRSKAVKEAVDTLRAVITAMDKNMRRSAQSFVTQRGPDTIMTIYIAWKQLHAPKHVTTSNGEEYALSIETGSGGSTPHRDGCGS